MTTTPEQLAKLPTYVRNEITKLRADVEFWKKQATAGPEDSDTFIEMLGDLDTPLGRSPRIAFHFPDEHHFKGYRELIARRREGYIEVSSSDRITISPVASNVVDIRLVD